MSKATATVSFLYCRSCFYVIEPSCTELYAQWYERREFRLAQIHRRSYFRQRQSVDTEFGISAMQEYNVEKGAVVKKYDLWIGWYTFG